MAQTKIFRFECAGCHVSSERQGRKCPTWCSDCLKARTRFLCVIATNDNYPRKSCKGCGIHMSNLDYGRAQFCEECADVRVRRHNGWSDPYATGTRLLFAANDNRPQRKVCLSCECDLPLDAFHKHATGGLGVSADCKECRAIVRSEQDRSQEYAARNERRGRRPKGERDTVNRKNRLITKWRKAVLAERKAIMSRVAKYVDRFYLVKQKPWLADGLRPGEKEKLRRVHDPDFLLRERTRSRLKRNGVKGDALKTMRRALNAANDNSSPARGMEALLGFSVATLREHLEDQFTEGMSWCEFQSGRIHIDHIRPLNTFDLTDSHQARLAWSLGNLRPLWARDNMKRPRDGRDTEWPAYLRPTG